MSKYIAGIKPLDTAYKTFEIKPRMGDLHFIKCTVPSVKGDIVLEIRKTDGHINMTVIIPAQTQAEVYLPLMDNEPLQNTGYEYALTDGYAKFVLSEGEYHL